MLGVSGVWVAVLPIRRLVRAHFLAFLLGALLPVSAVVAAEPVLQIGVLPNVSARVLASQYEPMQAYLSQRLKQAVEISTAPDWREFYQRVKRGDYQVVVAAANVARLMEKDLGFKPLLAYEPKIPALLIAPLANTASVARLVQGKSVALANPASLVVFEGLQWLGGKGLDAGRDYQVLQVRRDDSVGGAVLRGEAAAGILSMGEFRAHPDNLRAQLSIVSTMAEVASFLVCVAKDVDAERTAQIRSALLAFAQNSEEGKLFFQRTGFKGIVAVNERDLNGLNLYVDKTRNALE
jgi:phosphonate transport system substrate-binding protein